MKEPAQEEDTEVWQTLSKKETPIQDFESDYPFFQVLADPFRVEGAFFNNGS